MKNQAGEIKRLEIVVKEATDKVQQDNSGIYDRYDANMWRGNAKYWPVNMILAVAPRT